MKLKEGFIAVFVGLAIFQSILWTGVPALSQPTTTYDIHLYFHGEGSDVHMNTTAPSSLNSPTSGNITFALERALETDLTVYGEDSISLSFYASLTLPATSGTLKIEVMDNDVTIGNATTTFTTSALAQAVTVNVFDGDHTFDQGNRIKVRIEVENGALRYGSSLAPSHITISCNPISEITASSYNGEGIHTLLFYPNNWPDTMLVIKGTVTDALGDEDISAINVNISESESGEIVESGPANYTAGNFEFSWDYEAENLTSGQYDYRVIVKDIQGNEYYTTSHFFMAEEGVLVTSTSQAQEGSGPATKSGPYSGSTLYTLNIRNIGFPTSTYELALGSSDSSLGTLLDGDSITVAPGSCGQARLLVNTTGKAPYQTVNISVTASTGSASHTLYTNTFVSPYSIYILLNGDNNQTVLRGESITYEISIYNSGFETATVNLTIDKPAQWQAVVVPNKIFNLLPSGQKQANVTLTAPETLENRRDTATIKVSGTVAQDTIITYELEILATATNPIWLDLLDSNIKNVDADKTVTFSFNLYNMLPESSVISLTISGMSSYWQTTMLPANSVLIPAGESMLVTMQLLPSIRVEARTYSPFLTARSGTNTSHVDSVSVRVSVNPSHNVDISSNITDLSLKPGDKISRTFEVQNHGNMDEIVNLNSEVQEGAQTYNWVTFDDDQVTLQLQDKATITITIEVPEDVEIGEYTLYLNASTTTQQISAEPVGMNIYQTTGYLAQKAAKALIAPICLLGILSFVTFKIIRKK